MSGFENSFKVLTSRTFCCCPNDMSALSLCNSSGAMFATSSMSRTDTAVDNNDGHMEWQKQVMKAKHADSRKCFHLYSKGVSGNLIRRTCKAWRILRRLSKSDRQHPGAHQCTSWPFCRGSDQLLFSMVQIKSLSLSFHCGRQNSIMRSRCVDHV